MVKNCFRFLVGVFICLFLFSVNPFVYNYLHTELFIPRSHGKVTWWGLFFFCHPDCVVLFITEFWMILMFLKISYFCLACTFFFFKIFWIAVFFFFLKYQLIIQIYISRGIPGFLVPEEEIEHKHTFVAETGYITLLWGRKCAKPRIDFSSSKGTRVQRVGVFILAYPGLLAH